MGIYDREYYRRDGPSFLESFASRGQVCKWLIIINIGIYVVQLLTRYQVGRQWHDPFTNFFVLNVQAVADGQVWRLLTYAFLHAPDSPFHIVFNMLFLYWFGRDLEDIYGSKEFLAFYLGGALAGGAAYQLCWWTGITPDNSSCLGASGAVTAVMVLCAMHYPTRIIYLFLVLPVPIWLFVVFQVAQDLFGLLGAGVRENVAFSGHLGGAAFGFLYHKYNWRIVGWLPNLRSWQQQRSRPKLRVYREEEAPAPVPVAAAPPSIDMDEQFEAKVDAVLEKVARSGKSSLTEGEHQILMRASEVYKKRRS